jgi:hypothetical protein
MMLLKQDENIHLVHTRAARLCCLPKALSTGGILAYTKPRRKQEVQDLHEPSAASPFSCQLPQWATVTCPILVPCCVLPGKPYPIPHTPTFQPLLLSASSMASTSAFSRIKRSVSVSRTKGWSNRSGHPSLQQGHHSSTHTHTHTHTYTHTHTHSSTHIAAGHSRTRKRDRQMADYVFSVCWGTATRY